MMRAWDPKTKKTKSRIKLTTLGLLVGLGIVGAVASTAYRHLSSLAETELQVSHTHEVLETTEAVTIALGDVGAARRAFSLTRDEAALDLYRSALARLTSSRAALRSLTRDNPVQQQRLDLLDPLIAARLELMEQAIRDRLTIGFSAEREASLTTAVNSPTARLSVIALQSRLLARLFDGHASADEKRDVRVIADSAAYIDRLVQELLEMAYIESDQIEIHPEPVDLAPFLQSILERTVSTSDRARVLLVIEEPSTVSAESRRIERVIVNFVQNALKYSPPGSPIRVRLAVRDDRAVVSVTDEGPGIAPEDRSYVFDKYKRTASAKSKEGVGLGLYISRKIIEAHGGEIGVDGAPGQGATFSFRLPRIAAEPKSPSASLVVPLPDHRLRGLKVLLVDDETNALSALTALLGDEGIDVAGATSGEQALVVAHSKPPDVAVLDVQMPGMSGLALLERLRERHPGLPAVIMSGFQVQHPGIAAARESSETAYVGKPVDVDELMRTLDRMFPAGAGPIHR